MMERQYQLSEQAAENPKIQELSQLIREAAQENYYDDNPDITSFHPGYYSPEDENLVEKLVTSDDFKLLSSAEKRETVAALAIDYSQTWGLDVAPDPEPLLFTSNVPRVRIGAHPRDALVLSGAIGHEVTAIKSINKLASEIEPHRLRRSILLGGVVFSTLEGSPWFEQRYTSYSTLGADDELGYRTWIGADMHGDFRTVRQTIFKSGAVDPLGRTQVFGPTQEVIVGAYHSVELDIVRALLEYQVIYAGLNKQQLFNEVTKKVQGIERRPNSGPFSLQPFGDFGQDSGEHDARELRYSLNNPNETIGRTLLDNPTGPGSALAVRFQLIAENEGVTVAIASEEYPDSNKQFTLLKSEINEYIATLMTTELGRTSRPAMRNVLSALVTTEDPDRRLYN